MIIAGYPNDKTPHRETQLLGGRKIRTTIPYYIVNNIIISIIINNVNIDIIPSILQERIPLHE